VPRSGSLPCLSARSSRLDACACELSGEPDQRFPRARDLFRLDRVRLLCRGDDGASRPPRRFRSTGRIYSVVRLEHGGALPRKRRQLSVSTPDDRPDRFLTLDHGPNSSRAPAVDHACTTAQRQLAPSFSIFLRPVAVYRWSSLILAEDRSMVLQLNKLFSDREYHRNVNCFAFPGRRFISSDQAIAAPGPCMEDQLGMTMKWGSTYV
jgi:hypothetical protein